MPADRIGVRPPVFRLPAEVRLGKVTLQVANLQRSLEFYEGLLGFCVLNRGQGSADLGVHGNENVLLALREKRGIRPVPRRGLLGLYHFAVLLPTRVDLARFFRHCNDRRLQAGSADHLISEALYLTDPDGLTVEVYRDRTRTEWQITDEGEILASIDPLDSKGLLALADDGAWSGLPGGTTIGHIHFYVDDLRSAAAFYHLGLGFDKVLWSLPGALFVSAGLYHHHVGLNTWAADSPVATDEYGRLLSWELILPDRNSVQGAVESLRRTVHPVTTDERGYRASDPWGNTVVLRT